MIRSWKPNPQAAPRREVKASLRPHCERTGECPSLLDYKDQHASRSGRKLRSGTPAQRSLGSEVSGRPESRREVRREALLVRSISTPVSGRAPSLSLPLRIFAGGGGSSMACLSKLRREEGDGSGWGGGVSGSGRLLPSPHAPSPPLPEGAVGGGGKGRGKVVTRVNQPPLRGARAPGLAPRARAPASCLRRSYVNEGA